MHMIKVCLGEFFCLNNSEENKKSFIVQLQRQLLQEVLVW
ncbi:hypothetical protein D924_01220 [Enterococcus faecalis 06-MB-S-10]|nr:hypothetical protein D924_01220 [Enterococcus faecalis 06-MB-S-10]